MLSIMVKEDWDVMAENPILFGMEIRAVKVM